MKKQKLKIIERNIWHKQRGKVRKEEGGMIPSDEREDQEESVQFKMLNNSNFVPSMHSRYVTDDS